MIKGSGLLPCTFDYILEDRLEYYRSNKKGTMIWCKWAVRVRGSYDRDGTIFTPSVLDTPRKTAPQNDRLVALRQYVR